MLAKKLKFTITGFGFLLFSILSLAQHRTKGIVLDHADKTPLEFVGVYNNQDHTITNEDGRFLFTSLSDSVTFYRVGYDKFRSSFAMLKDTVYLHKSVLKLNEVTVTNQKTRWQKVRDSLSANYPLYPYKEKFLVRGILRYNGDITRIQDMQGKLRRKTLLYTKDIEPNKKDFEVELTNMRKVGLVQDENQVYFIFYTFRELFMNLTPLNATSENFDLTEATFDNGRKIKLSYQLVPEIMDKKISGHYIINSKNNAVEYFYMHELYPNATYNKSGETRYRTTEITRQIALEKVASTAKYYIASSKIDVKVEITDKSSSYASTYDVSFIMTTTENEGDFALKKNVSTAKDLFKIKYPYNPMYWNTQNELLLTDEMLAFIRKVNDPSNEFKIKSNLIIK